MRVFCFANKKMPSAPCGGGAGVAYRLHLANSKYKKIPNITFIFLDKIIVHNQDFMQYDVSSSDDEVTYSIAQLMVYFKELNKLFDFGNDDCYMFHDLDSFYALYHTLGGIIHSIVVYHGQGSLYNEAVASGMEPNEEYRRECLELTRFSILNSEIFGFPSIGAKQALIDTMPEIKSDLEKHNDVKILYNGCSPIIHREQSMVGELVDYLKQLDIHKFVTVCTLNEAKGVDLLPDFFKKYGEHNDYIWILLGDGAKRDIIKEKISGMEEHVIWLTNWFSNNDILQILNCTDFYILNQRLSIFDFSTIEAMHMGNIPVLSPVGGNLEMIKDNSGYFLKAADDADGFSAWLDSIQIEQIKEKNINIAKNLFSERTFLEQYLEVIGG